MEQTPTMDQLVTSMKEQLLSALCKKADAEAVVKEQDMTIQALRNALAGIQAAGQTAPPPAPPAASPVVDSNTVA